MDETPQQKLEKLANEIDALLKIAKKQKFKPPVSRDNAEWFVEAVASLSTGKPLKEVFGHRRGRGSPKKEKIPARARKIFDSRFSKKDRPTWDALAEQYGVDPRDLQREQDRYSERLVSEFTRGLIEEMIEENKAKPFGQ